MQVCGSANMGQLHGHSWVVVLVLSLLSLSPERAFADDGSTVTKSASGQAALNQFDDAKASGGKSKPAKEDDDRGLVLLPVIVSDPLLGVGLGAAGMYSFLLGEGPHARGSYISASALITTNKQIKLALTHNIDVSEDHFVFRGRILFKLFSEDYWGIGNDTPDSNQRQLKYDSIDYLGRLNVATTYENWFVGPLIRFYITWNTSLEEPYPPPELAGDELKSFLMLGLGLSLVYDSRDNLTNTYEGFYAALELINLPSGFPRAPDTTVGNINATADIRGFWKPFPELDHIFAARAAAELTFGRVPFAMLPSPGRDEKLRGHLEGRLRDYDLVSVDLEYRIRWWGPLGSTVFASWALLFGEEGDRITWNTMPKSVGFGLRYMVQKTDRVNLRLDIGFDFEGTTAVIFECGEAF
jgi:hypothetical protein